MFASQIWTVQVIDIVSSLQLLYAEFPQKQVTIFTKAGTYTFTATNGTCPTGGCCPVIIEEINCCPAEICIPFTIIKRRK